MYTDKYGKTYYRVALHLHSTQSDGRCTPEEIAKSFKDAGYDAIAFTDHWNYCDGGELCGLHIISGIEYDISDDHDDTIHIVSLGAKEDPKVNKDDSCREIIDKINDAGGAAVLAHPAWSINSIETAKKYNGFTATEIYNAVSEAGSSLRAYSDHFVDICAKNGIFYGILATDDAHYYGGIDDMHGWVMIAAEALTDEAIVKAIKDRNFFATQGPTLSVELKGNRLIIETSPCDVIAVLSSRAWLPNRVLRGEGITRHEYEIHPTEKWARIEVRSGDKRAWSNVIQLN